MKQGKMNNAGCEIPQVAKISQPGNSQAQKQPLSSLQHLQNKKEKDMRSQTCKRENFQKKDKLKQGNQ